jgi:formate hydrogenlyase subunit 6/NADH:ubiquinone oxidoreductase subunit I
MFKVDKGKCVGCGECVNVCPAGAISLKDNKAVISDKCVDCGRCAQVCPQGAIYPAAGVQQSFQPDQGQMFGGSGFGMRSGRGRGLGRGMGRGLGRGPRDGRGGGRGGGGRGR